MAYHMSPSSWGLPCQPAHLLIRKKKQRGTHTHERGLLRLGVPPTPDSSDSGFLLLATLETADSSGPRNLDDGNITSDVAT